MNKAKLPDILLLSAAEKTVLNDAFVQALNARLAGICRLEWHNYHDLGLELDTGRLRAFLVDGDRPLTDFSHVYFKSYFQYQELAIAIAETLKANDVPFTGKELRRYIPAYKLSQLSRLASNDFSLPKTIYLPMEHVVNHFHDLESKLGLPFVFKAMDGGQGEDNHLIKSRQQLAEIAAANPGRHFIAQEFIANDSDLRVLVIDGEVKLVIERRRQDDSTHLNNTSQGATAKLIPIDKLDQEIRQLALDAAKLMGRDVAGVDVVVEHGTGKPYILEVNASPQIAGGAFLEEKRDIYEAYFAGLAGGRRG